MHLLDYDQLSLLSNLKKTIKERVQNQEHCISLILSKGRKHHKKQHGIVINVLIISYDQCLCFNFFLQSCLFYSPLKIFFFFSPRYFTSIQKKKKNFWGMEGKKTVETGSTSQVHENVPLLQEGMLLLYTHRDTSSSILI